MDSESDVHTALVLLPTRLGKKSVLVKMPQDRNLKITFTCTPLGDFHDFNEAFQKVCSNDKLLCHQADNFIFKTYDSLFNCMIDVTSNLSIEHGSIFEAHYISMPVAAIEPQQPTKVIQIKREPIEYEIMPTTSSNLDSTQQSSRSPTSYQTLFAIDETSSPAPTGGSKSASASISKLCYPCPLPEFSPRLRAALQKNSISNKYYSMFVRECAAFLMSLKFYPTKAEYGNFCRTVSDHYTFVNDNFTVLPYAHFKKMLCRSIRNMKYYCAHGRKNSMPTKAGKFQEFDAVGLSDECTTKELPQSTAEQCMNMEQITADQCTNME